MEIIGMLLTLLGVFVVVFLCLIAEDISITRVLFLSILSIALLSIGIAMCIEGGYENGQIDYMNSNVKYEKHYIINQDGAIIDSTYVKIKNQKP